MHWPGDYFFNYGLMPQTFEDPKIRFQGTEFFGDGDPLDALEIGSAQLSIGDVAIVKVITEFHDFERFHSSLTSFESCFCCQVLGALPLVDKNAMDWKILVIRIDDPLAALMNDVQDVEKHMKGALPALKTYFAEYKRAEGFVNTFANFGPDKLKYGSTSPMDSRSTGFALSRARALEVIRETHEHWLKSFSHKQQSLKASPVREIWARNSVIGV
jgi:inorganic pyrophosphatase